MSKKRYKYSFTKRRHTKGGIESSVFALLSLLLFFVCAVSSMVFNGAGGLYLGAIGLSALGISVYGFILGLKSFSEKNRQLFYSKIGSVANGVLMVIWVAMFLLGIE